MFTRNIRPLRLRHVPAARFLAPALLLSLVCAAPAAADPAGEGIKTRGSLSMAMLKSVLETADSFVLAAPGVELKNLPQDSHVYTFMNMPMSVTDTSPLPKDSARGKILEPVDFTKLFYLEPATGRIFFTLRTASTTYYLYGVDPVSWRIGGLFIDKSAGKDPDANIQNASREFFATIASLRPLPMTTISGDGRVANGTTPFKPPKGGPTYIPVWEGLSLDPPIYAVVFQGKDAGKGPMDYAPKSPTYIRRGYKIALVFPPGRDSLVAAIRPEALYRDGYSIVDGYGKDGFDRQGYDREGYDRYGWSDPRRFAFRISELAPGSAAAKAGILAGDLILDLDGKPFTLMEHITSILESRKPGNSTSLSFRRGEAPARTVTASLGSRKDDPTKATLGIAGAYIPWVPAEARTRAGDRWSGSLAKGREGFGTLTKPDGTRYLGTFREDKEEGLGILIPPAGNPRIQTWSKGTLLKSRAPAGAISSSLRTWVFLGEGSSSGLAQGPGDAISADGRYRIEGGVFKNGIFVSGSLVTPDETRYVGTFSDEVLVSGRIEGRDGSRYEGPLAGGLPEGRGKITTADGTTYAGEFKAGLYEGQGTIARQDGEKYEGAFRGGKPHGIGIYFNGDTIERCEYYDGKRIDQAYLIKTANEKQLEALRVERERAAKEKADQAEMARLASERAAAEKLAREGKSSNKLMAGIFGVGATLLGSRAGLGDAEALLYGLSVAQDIAKGDASLSGSTATAQTIIDARGGGTSGPAGGTGTGSGAPSAAPKFRVKTNLLDEVDSAKVKNGAWKQYSGDGQIYPFFQQAQMYFEEYKNAVANGISEAECNKVYELHRQATEYAINVWKGYGLDK